MRKSIFTLTFLVLIFCGLTADLKGSKGEDYSWLGEEDLGYLPIEVARAISQEPNVEKQKKIFEAWKLQSTMSPGDQEYGLSTSSFTVNFGDEKAHVSTSGGSAFLPSYQSAENPSGGSGYQTLGLITDIEEEARNHVSQDIESRGCCSSCFSCWDTSESDALTEQTPLVANAQVEEHEPRFCKNSRCMARFCEMTDSWKFPAAFMGASFSITIIVMLAVNFT